MYYQCNITQAFIYVQKQASALYIHRRYKVYTTNTSILRTTKNVKKEIDINHLSTITKQKQTRFILIRCNAYWRYYLVTLPVLSSVFFFIFLKYKILILNNQF